MDLKELLGEDLYNQVIRKAGENKIAIVSDGNWFPKEKFDQVNNDNKDLKKQLKDRDEQLSDLKIKAAGNEELTNQINDLTELNKKTASDYQAKLDQQAFDFALKEALSGAKAKNPKAVEALLNKEAIKLDGEKLLGLEEQLKAIKESDSYLFETEQQEQQQGSGIKFTTGQHQKQSGGEPRTLLDALNQRFSTTNN
ncbi:phage scaffolding protein [Cytobacillus oceanisediminis]|uniref:phage scaffolding protein n=1 Tax=Cytobacillus oceanisediminis TaxID=665099 RepID=UPI0018642721|nr:phage scaffolding protein [Cytobacillus oceanisediminis]MCM3528277.1 phage scaffolding protein [Cytobacillus oceanisediminis]QOK27669.1 phage scaffolding protein [Cytobacillus oceanisediminis]